MLRGMGVQVSQAAIRANSLRSKELDVYLPPDIGRSITPKTIEERKNLQNYQRLIIVHVLLLGTVIFSGKEFLVKLILLALAGLAVQ